MTSLSLSHSSGISDQPLLDFSIGAALRDAAARFPDRAAIVSIFQGQRYSYAQLDEAADTVAAALVALGSMPGIMWRSGARIAPSG